MKCFLALTLIFSFSLVAKAAQTKAIEVTEQDSNAIFQGEWLVMFYAPWCPACQNLKPTWQSFAKQWSEELQIKVGMVNIVDNSALSGQFMVFQLPTIFHIKDGVVRHYTGSRSQDAFVNWINDKSYENVEPIEWYINPNSIQMKAMGQFFRFANAIKDLHEMLTNKYNIPTWGIYTIFGVATVLAGLLIGLFMVVICDCICPAKPPVVVDKRQYSRVEVTPSKKLRTNPKAASKQAEKKESDNESPADDDQQESATDGESSGTVRKRKARKE